MQTAILNVSDGRLLALIQSFLDQSILEELSEWTPDAGVPQGAVLSPLLSNLYLSELDHRLAELGYEMVRYCDDFVILCGSQDEADSALEEITQTIAEINAVTSGWFTYFRHSNWMVFDAYDGRIRRRLRRQLLKCHRHNPQRLSRTRRWPNAYFTDLGFRSLRDAHTRYVQSLSSGNH